MGLPEYKVPFLEATFNYSTADLFSSIGNSIWDSIARVIISSADKLYKTSPRNLTFHVRQLQGYVIIESESSVIRIQKEKLKEIIKVYEQSKIEAEAMSELSLEARQKLIARIDAALDTHLDKIITYDDSSYQTNYHSAAENKPTLANFTLIDISESSTPKLTTEYARDILTPYLNAIKNLQEIINDIQGRKTRKVEIVNIKQNSPISVSLDGASEAIQVIKDTVVPWRRKHAESMARLIEQEKSVEIEAKKAEVVDKKIIAREQANKLKLENEKLRLELQQAKIQLAIEVLNSISHNLSQTEREAVISKLLPILETLALSRLEVVNPK
jgi:hypothetical protein